MGPRRTKSNPIMKLIDILTLITLGLGLLMAYGMLIDYVARWVMSRKPRKQ
jgi:hypothetical protein